MRWRAIDILIVAAAIGIIACGYYLITQRPCEGARCDITERPN